jgi:signal transduction histidine kinase
LYASVDLDAFNKILNNLFSNAIKYAGRNAVITLAPFQFMDNGFTIEFKNDGAFIPMEMKDKIFEPFVRLKQSEKQKGTGIGLALARSLTQLHKGSLELKEPANNFNVFVLSLPIRQENEFTLIIDKNKIAGKAQNTVDETQDIIS